jgi:hypothetical protein
MLIKFLKSLIKPSLKSDDLVIETSFESAVPVHGMLAERDGFKLEDNPYRQHTPDHSIWRDDWLFSAGRFK